MNSSQKIDTKKLALASILGALAAVSELIRGPPFDISFPLLPNVISWDLTGIPIMISLLYTDLIGGIYTAIIGCSIIFLRGNVAGGIFKLAAELATILAFAIINKGVIIKTVSAVIFRVLLMTGVNYYFLPIFYPNLYSSQAAVVGILVPLALFNITQALLNIVPAYTIHWKLSRKLKF
jgi:hypothetical protein